MLTAWLFSHGTWAVVDDGWEEAQELYATVPGFDFFQARGFAVAEKLGGRATLYEYIGTEIPTPGQYLVLYEIGTMWHCIYAAALPDVLHLLALLAPIDRTWPPLTEMGDVSRFLATMKW